MAGFGYGGAGFGGGGHIDAGYGGGYADAGYGGGYVDAGYGGGFVDAGYGGGFVDAGYGGGFVDAGYGGGFVDAGYGGGFVDAGYGGGFVDAGYGGGFVDAGYGGYGTTPIVEEVYVVEPVMDQLSGLGYNGPWPQSFYDPCRPRKPCKEESSSDSDSDDDSYKRRRPCRRPPPCPQNKGVSAADINLLLNKFEDALQVKYKRAEIVELDQKNELMKDLAKEKKEIQRELAKARRDLLLKDALAFNAHSAIPGTRHPLPTPGKQVVSIDFGQNKQQALPAPGRGGAAIYSGGAQQPQQPPPRQAQFRPQLAPQVIYH